VDRAELHGQESLMISPRKALRILGRRPAKRLGQHFLIHRTTAEKIAAAINPTPEDVVVEIGAGLGALTWPLSRSGARVVAVEIDPELAEFLHKELAERQCDERVSIECRDILQLTFADLYGRFGKKLKIIGNLPYNIGSPVLFKLMKEAHCIREAVLMLQKEVAERVLAEPGSRNYGILSVMAVYHSEPKRLMRLKPSLFHPPPKVDSQVISLSFRSCLLEPKVEERWLLQVVKAAFAHRRKTLKNSLLASKLPGVPREAIATALAEAAIEPGRRPESLDLGEFIQLAAALGKVSGNSGVSPKRDV
jgi:16S rRNA (adenine1518-N6/adenine1519-N6)-dimethyltransferase